MMRMEAEMKSRQPKGREMAGAGREYVKPKAKTGVEMYGHHHTLLSRPMVVALPGDEVPKGMVTRVVEGGKARGVQKK